MSLAFISLYSTRGCLKGWSKFSLIVVCMLSFGLTFWRMDIKIAACALMNAFKERKKLKKNSEFIHMKTI